MCMAYAFSCLVTSKVTDLSGRAATVNVPLETLMQILQQQQQNGQVSKFKLCMYTYNFLPYCGLL
jgi:hypothetical protein